ncbi:aspartate/glutamate racemase family protein [Plantactinospora sp. GCM10030261]|uniref:aspartate/glutamate racemase family protein n=1 Tax=Plantactinospora sp. GCM10030261 TaxID=3273420 RepID=UPI003610AFC0
MTEASVAVGLLHTVPALATTFDDLIRATAPELRRIHLADAWLLDTARRTGVTDAVRATVLDHIRHLETLGAAAVLVTCSSIGEAAEAAGAAVRVPVIRVDAAMADEATAIASGPEARGRIAVLATLSSTLGPTGRLVERATGAASRPVAVTADVVTSAAEAHDAGDRDRVDSLVAAAVSRAAAEADVVVLAQASMARAAKLAEVPVPVLSSPAGGVAALLHAVGHGQAAP